jgi:hypothetical protein
MATEVRDPLHGAIRVEPAELLLIDHPAFQRLRHVRQLGFSEMSFPGATHTRYLHSLGTMEVATRAFDAMFNRWIFATPANRNRFRQMVRLAALLHDLGHTPLSHAAEFAMPSVGELGLAPRLPRTGVAADQQATHEHMTLRFLLDSSFSQSLEEAFPIPAAAVAGLIDTDLEVEEGTYQDGDQDYRPVLSQLVSSELDADRMDYLARDSYFSGVQYGHVDMDWIVRSLRPHAVDGQIHLSLDGRALYTLEHLLLARYHMFLMVYFHYRSVAYEQLLREFLADGGDGYRIPSDPDAYVEFDDAHLLGVLRRSEHPAARRIVDRRGYGLLLERHGTGERRLVRDEVQALTEEGIVHQHVTSRGVVSKYMRARWRADAPSIYVVWRSPAEPERVEPLDRATDLFEKYARARRISRIYVPDEEFERAGRVLRG